MKDAIPTVLIFVGAIFLFGFGGYLGQSRGRQEGAILHAQGKIIVSTSLTTNFITTVVK